MAIVFDLETDGLLDQVTKIHCLVIKDTNTGQIDTFIGDDIITGLTYLKRSSVIAGHNVIKYDIPVIQKLYPWFTIDPTKVFDTLVATRLIWANIKDTDTTLLKQEKLPGKLFGSHSLAAWGYRLGNYKGDYSGGWETFSQEMLDYCVQDVEVTASLYQKIIDKDYAQPSLDLEHQVAWLMAKQERNGFHFDMKKAAELLGTLVQRRGELERELKEYFGSWEVQLPDFVPARDNKTLGYKKGIPVKKTKTVEFNPSSRDHIADRLITLYGWKPADFTEGGKPMVDEVVLGKLSYPPCKQLTEYLLVQKRISQLNEGGQAWMKCEKKGKIHGSINPNGAVTGRATHSYPNISQVPSSGSPYGPECRELFTVPADWLLVGADASGLELRCLAHFMAKWDGGKYAEILLGGDIHTENQKAAGLLTRNQAKTFIYAFLYGAGDAKIGSITGGAASEGRKLKQKFLRSLPALGRLVEAVQGAAKRGYLVGLDGRHIHVRSSHAALNTLLQSAGALVCKKWLVLLEEHLQTAGLKHGWDGDYAFCAWSHDECQIACRTPEIASAVRKMAEECVLKAGDYFGFRCPTAGESKVGKTWADTH
ncbi:PolA DNA polymerase I - 3'-5' exonuclease and polymerase domains [uncultured Caudovirales phage]|uniref:PolA DNA polymerase I - 3'-5' exonuclease and polymerase domains n=1 Tax=uncultured Caudovirales phage TaxID=2100421 RepID=A0A6J5MWA0_9CAUD|nr:PolA DNA polymerase I - 3'-5' exonuclease and polymerase domains [uncultured Caudovirales phage]